MPVLLSRLAKGVILSLLLSGAVSGQDFILTEFMASNSSGQTDEDGEFSDWIEIYNPASTAQSLAGWSLSDDRGNLRRWLFPAVTVNPGSYILVFASGKNRTNSSATFHANFKLDRNGGYLALVRPDGAIATEFASYPEQLTDVSFGMGMSKFNQSLVASSAPLRMLIPDAESAVGNWKELGYDDSFWLPAAGAVGYDRIPPGQDDPPPREDVSTPGDAIVPTSFNSPNGEEVGKAIDNSIATKYLNFDKLYAGFTVTFGNGPAIVSGLRLVSANDADERDPTSYVLSGSTDGRTFAEVAKGPIPPFPNRFTAVQVDFANTNAYPIYQLIFPTVRNAGSAVAMQIAEVEFLGQVRAELPAIADFVQTDIEDLLYGTGKTSVQLRIPFEVHEGATWDDAYLLLRYDDGFAAWLNGISVARANNPSTLSFDATAVTNRLRRDAIQQVKYDLKPFISSFQTGQNILAIQSWNDRADSPDLLMDWEIIASRDVQHAHGYLDQPTPGNFNSEAKTGVVAEPQLGLNHGFFDAPFELTVSSATPGSSIRYTVDGSLPTATNGTPANGSITIDRTTVLRVAAFKEQWRTSRVVTRTFIFPSDVAGQTKASALAAGYPNNWNGQGADYGLDPRVVGPADNYGGKYGRTFKDDLKTLPTMSITMPREDLFGASGIYANPLNRGEEWERPGSIEMIYPEGKPGFQADAGFRIQGGAFRNFNLSLKKSFRVIFRSRYGEGTLSYPLFGTNAAGRINNFVLRANSNDAYPYGGPSAVYTRDAFAMETIRAMGGISSHLNFVHLYINGLYWGVYSPTERPDAAFSASYYGGEKEQWDSINQDSVPDGNDLAWQRMLAMLNQDFTSDVPYQRIQGNNPDGTRNPNYEQLLDVDNMIDYMIMNLYIGNVDWPHRNWWASRNRDNGNGFKFHPWDSETALGLSPLDVNVTGVNNAAAAPYAALRKNAAFRLRFADHVYRHFFHGGVFYVNPSSTAWNPATPQNNRPAERFYQLSETIRRAMVGESARWGDQIHGGTPYTRDEHWLPSRNALLTGYFPRRSAIVLAQFRAAGLYPKIDPPSMSMRGGQVEPGFELTLSAPAGTIYYTLDGSDPRMTNRAAIYSGAITLNTSANVKSRLYHAGEWSALNEGRFTMGQSSIIVTELHYHPSKPTDAEKLAGILDSDEFEFLELHNPGNVGFELAGVAFTNGIQFNFTTNAIKQLEPGNYLLLVRNRKAFELRYGTGHTILGEYQGKLDNSGERIRAVHSSGQTIIDFAYGVVSPWPAVADGAGPSLELKDVELDPADSSSWRPSVANGGSPGKPNPIPPFFLEKVQLEAGKLKFSFTGRKGVGYRVFASDDLAPNAQWRLVTEAGPSPGEEKVELLLPVEGSQRFFRISIP